MANVEDKRNFLRKAGDAVGQFFVDRDREYATRVVDDSQGMLAMTQLLGGSPIAPVNVATAKELAEIGARTEPGGGPIGMGPIRRHQAVEYGLGAGILATNLGYRYGLPAAGVTLAGKGLYDLTAGMNEQTSGTLMP
jgi:hypothetical protein